MLIWRICLKRYSDSSFSGEGAKLWGGRWNSPGRSLVYCSTHLSLASLETIAHLHRDDFPLTEETLFVTPAELSDDALRETLDQNILPTNWRESCEELQLIGDEWLESNRSLVLVVPSVIVPQESNYLINPIHTDFSSSITKLEPFPFILDHRIQSLILGN